MTKPRVFPNKMLQAAYDAAIGKTFTWSPTFQVFTDETGNSDYDYSAMIWLKTSGHLEETFDKNQFVWLFKVK